MPPNASTFHSLFEDRGFGGGSEAERMILKSLIASMYVLLRCEVISAAPSKRAVLAPPNLQRHWESPIDPSQITVSVARAVKRAQAVRIPRLGTVGETQSQRKGSGKWNSQFVSTKQHPGANRDLSEEGALAEEAKQLEDVFQKPKDFQVASLRHALSERVTITYLTPLPLPTETAVVLPTTALPTPEHTALASLVPIVYDATPDVSPEISPDISVDGISFEVTVPQIPATWVIEPSPAYSAELMAGEDEGLFENLDEISAESSPPIKQDEKPYVYVDLGSGPASPWWSVWPGIRILYKRARAWLY